MDASQDVVGAGWCPWETLYHPQSVTVFQRGFWLLEKDKWCIALFKKGKKVGLGSVRLVSLTSDHGKIIKWIFLEGMSRWLRRTKWWQVWISKDKLHLTNWIAFYNIAYRQVESSGYLSLVRPSEQSPVVYLQPDWWGIDSIVELYSRWKTF